MKHYGDSSKYTNEKDRARGKYREYKAGGFRCSHCRHFVAIDSLMGTANRNHCNACLWSKHVDNQKGDRSADCQGGMEPIGLTFKHEGYGRQGEIMVIHLCLKCQKISINRIARDDDNSSVIAVFENSYVLDKGIKLNLIRDDVYLLAKQDNEQLRRQLFGT